MTGYRTRSMMCHPIVTPGANLGLFSGSSGRSSPSSLSMSSSVSSAEPEVIGVAQVINKAVGGSGGGGFTAHDDAVFSKYLQFCGIGLRNAQLYERSQLEVRRNQVLLDLAGVIFQVNCHLDRVLKSVRAWPILP